MVLCMNDRRRVPGLARAAGILVLALVGGLSGCATMSGGVAGDVARSLSDAASASQSAALAFEQNLDDRSTDAVTGTTLDDMLDEMQTAATAVTELDATTREQIRLRSAATAVIRDCADSITRAREFLARSAADSGDATLHDLQAAADEARDLSDELERYR
jgi:hypothetical protein